MEKKIKIGEKEFTVRELTYAEALTLNFDNKADALKKMTVLSTGISDEEFNTLSIKEGIEIQKAVNEVNALDFQLPTEENK